MHFLPSSAKSWRSADEVKFIIFTELEVSGIRIVDSVLQFVLKDHLFVTNGETKIHIVFYVKLALPPGFS